jgi:hypothetical protein
VVWIAQASTAGGIVRISIITGIALIIAQTSYGACVSKPLTCGATVTDSLSSSTSCVVQTFPTATYSFSGTAGQSLTLLASTTSGHTIGLTLDDPSGQRINSTFDEPAGFTTTLPATGNYVVSVNFGNPHDSGTFTLKATCNATTPPPADTCFYSGTLRAGDTISGQLTSADAACGTSKSYMKAYKIALNEGDAIEVQYTASYPVYLEIDGPDRSGGWRSSTTTTTTSSYIATATGITSIWIGSSGSTPVAGSFTVRVNAITLPPCGRVRVARH